MISHDPFILLSNPLCLLSNSSDCYVAGLFSPSSQLFCLLSIAYRSKVMCLLSTLSSFQSYVSPLMTLSALQLCSSSQGHGSSYGNILQLLFTANVCCHDDVTAFGHRLRPEVLNMVLKSETEAFQVQSLMSNQMTIAPPARWLGYLVSESFSKLSEIDA